MTRSATTRRRFLLASTSLTALGAAPILLAQRQPASSARQQLRLTSNDGRWQAYADVLPADGSIYAPGGRDETTIVVRDQLTNQHTAMTLDRNLEPEAFSPDGSTLYAIDHRPAHDPEVYRVSTIRVATGEITDTIGPRKISLVEEMRGTGRQQVWSPDGDQLYTLYLRQLHDHSAHDATGAHDHDLVTFTDAFVHVLDVANGWALCVELPDGIGVADTDAVAIMIDDTGTLITVVDHALGSRVDVTRLPDRGDDQGYFSVSPLLPIVD